MDPVYPDFSRYQFQMPLGSYIKTGQSLYPNRFITNGRDYLLLSTDGNLKLYASVQPFSPGATASWTTNFDTSTLTGPFALHVRASGLFLYDGGSKTYYGTVMRSFDPSTEYLAMQFSEPTQVGFLMVNSIGITGGQFLSTINRVTSQPLLTKTTPAGQPLIFHSGLVQPPLDISLRLEFSFGFLRLVFTTVDQRGSFDKFVMSEAYQSAPLNTNPQDVSFTQRFENSQLCFESCILGSNCYTWCPFSSAYQYQRYTMLQGFPSLLLLDSNYQIAYSLNPTTILITPQF
ncbi:hypothetical protein DFA_06312 [Cavenderia fasciculata]|uniref:Bulb-type lectin domain-containing protein n=1 Tax=Cavenderia fasciculata TaxID=261658 RepID=F4PKP2_CACFS|nr:uncharacterized protein DFA_06312 [Cavenderia fasciculata]EGG24166.1 hypothetical protein DFA_06312 [Cavenderia fasciculata]|eukprot:XP_004362017.1 hypothetical protein DFA_06312 [Cavenderia fasciculata]